MGTKKSDPKKDDTIKIRVTTEIKNLIKEVAPGGDMSKFILKHTKPIAEQKKVSMQYENYLEDRAKRTDEKLMSIREKMVQRGNNKK